MRITCMRYRDVALVVAYDVLRNNIPTIGELRHHKVGSRTLMQSEYLQFRDAYKAEIRRLEARLAERGIDFAPV